MNLNDIVCISSGKFSSQESGWIHPERIIDSYEIIFVISGIFKIQEAKNIYELHAGDLLILDKNTLHKGVDSASALPVSFYWGHFDEYPSNLLLPKHMQISNQANLIVLFKQLIHYNYSSLYPSFASDLTMRMILTEINVQYMNTRKEHGTLINEMCEWIRINIDKNITVKDVSEQFGYNQDYLTHFMKQAGLPGIKQLIIQAKCDRARYLLLTTKLPLKAVSIQLGFSDTNDFLKFFKRHEGMTPSDFRNIYSKTHLNKK